MYHGLIHTKIQSGDIVFFAHSFFFPDTEIQFLRDAKEYCEARGAAFAFINLPMLADAYHTDEERILTKILAVNFAEEAEEKTSLALHRLRERRISYCDLREALLLRNRKGRESFYVDSIHFGANGNIWIADELFKFLERLIAKGSDERAKEEKTRKFDEFTEFAKTLSRRNDMEGYITKIAKKHKRKGVSNAGAVVINANPFTKGHLHLVEQALTKCDFLYIFVVEEDKSEFPFELRLRLVREGVAHLANTAVIPSGKFILSSLTFGGYFGRDDSRSDVVDASEDLTLFAAHIAPAMGIGKRFVGEEPFSAVTNHYHEQMKEILPAHGIEVVVIPRRLTPDGRNVVSASTVRGLIKKQEWSELKKYVPETTFSYIVHSAGRDADINQRKRSGRGL
jgi:[citrate (pro-3S)-lyase] ligase